MRADLPRFRMNPTGPERSATPSNASLFLRFWLPVLIYIGLIFGASSIPGRDIPNLFPYMDKLEHLTEYSLFGLLLGRAFRFTVGGGRGKFWSLATVAFGGLVGGMDELYQRLTPGRSSDIRDWAVDVTAVTLAVLFTQYVRIHPLLRRRESLPTPEKGTP
jgi:VanZ family protein